MSGAPDLGKLTVKTRYGSSSNTRCTTDPSKPEYEVCAESQKPPSTAPHLDIVSKQLASCIVAIAASSHPPRLSAARELRPVYSHPAATT